MARLSELYLLLLRLEEALALHLRHLHLEHPVHPPLLPVLAQRQSLLQCLQLYHLHVLDLLPLSDILLHQLRLPLPLRRLPSLLPLHQPPLHLRLRL